MLHRIAAGRYETPDGRVQITDNGNGFGPARGSRRWALVVDGEWRANIDLLADAKRAARSAREQLEG
jgi:hypothetical protein